MEQKRVMMQWYSSSDRLPENQQEVLIHFHGKYSIATYDRVAGGFLLRGGAFFHPSEWDINWARIGGPEKRD